MQIAHIAVWTTRLEELRNFYVTYFGGESSDKYVNPGKGVESYFVRFGHSAALELIRRTDIIPYLGYTQKNIIGGFKFRRIKIIE